MKTVCKQVYAHYPEFDLAHKKDFIKTTVKSVSEVVSLLGKLTCFCSVVETCDLIRLNG
jgi:hypothetical protein